MSMTRTKMVLDKAFFELTSRHVAIIERSIVNVYTYVYVYKDCKHVCMYEYMHVYIHIYLLQMGFGYRIQIFYHHDDSVVHYYEQ